MEDSDGEDDILHYSHEKIRNLIKENADKTVGIRKYLKEVHFPPINDFKEGLEWFNVAEPLSFAKHLKGKLVILDFFTYCCINCMHILPDLKEIEKEFSIEDGLVVVGVHSAKFENEKQSSNILAAVQRYNIIHPVVNDHNSEMWRNCDVHCWPTLILFGPNANPLVLLTGEGHKNDLLLYIRNALIYYKEKNLISNHKLPIKSAYHLLPKLRGPLLFPGKITNFVFENGQEMLGVSDSGNNRVLVLNINGSVVKCIGGSKAGFKDGNIATAEFNNPQGVVFQTKNILYVADTDNHAIRKIDLEANTVETVTGTGVQGHDRNGGKLWKQQAISSPWDVTIYKTVDVDQPDGKTKDVLLIAMAGTHQIWALFLDDTVWWKSQKYSAGTCVCIAGSGREENRNNQYPHAAAFAQPSGLALSINKKEVYIADSESSSVRRLSLVDGKVTPVIGGDRNPNNLFAFGDKDGALYEAKLQHSLGVALSKNGSTLFVADTYNHKLKKVDVEKNTVTTLSLPPGDTTDGLSSGFSEPAGLCLSADDTKLYLADTNNHFIKVIQLNENKNIKSIEKLNVQIVDKSKYDMLKHKSFVLGKNGGSLEIKINISFKDGLKLNDEAVQNWSVEVPNPSWICDQKAGSNVENIKIVIKVPESDTETQVNFIFNLVTCTTETCLVKSFIIGIPVMFTGDGPSRVNELLNLIIDPADVVLGK